MSINETLAGLIQPGDFMATPNEVIETVAGVYEARSDFSIRPDTYFEKGFVSVRSGGFGIPVSGDSVLAVYRGKACLWQRSEHQTQLRMFEE